MRPNRLLATADGAESATGYDTSGIEPPAAPGEAEDEAAAAAAGVADSDVARDAQIEHDAAAEKMHDPRYQLDVMNGDTLQAILVLERDWEERDDPEKPGEKMRVRLPEPVMVPKQITVRYDLTPAQISKTRMWDHFDQFTALVQSQLMQFQVDVPAEPSAAWWNDHPRYVYAALAHPDVRRKSREIVAVLSDTPVTEITEGLSTEVLDVIMLAVHRRYKEESDRRKNRRAGVLAPATSTPSS